MIKKVKNWLFGNEEKNNLQLNIAEEQNLTDQDSNQTIIDLDALKNSILEDNPNLLSNIMEKIGYQFKNIHLLIHALIHKSFSKAVNYERLEFIGDGILNCVISIYLFKKYPYANEGELSRARSIMVSQDGIINIAKGIGVSNCMIISASEERSGGRQKQSICADIVEAIIAAIYLDIAEYKGDYLEDQNTKINVKEKIDTAFDEVFKIVEKLFNNYFEFELDKMTVGQRNYKSLLQEYLQNMYISPPQYILLDVYGQNNDTHFTVECQIKQLLIYTTGIASDKKTASQIAAKRAYELIRRK